MSLLLPPWFVLLGSEDGRPVWPRKLLTSLRKRPRPAGDRCTGSMRTLGSILPSLSSFHSASCDKNAVFVVLHISRSAELKARDVLSLLHVRRGGTADTATVASDSLLRTVVIRDLYCPIS